MPSAQTDCERLFFALWPEPHVRVRLERLVRGATVGRIDRPVAAQKLHLTLVFLGACTLRQRDCMIAAAGQVRAAQFSLCLDRMGYWRRSRIVWAGTEVTPPELTELVNALNARLGPCGHQRESRPFQAHLTLARKAVSAVALTPIEPIIWPVQAFCLVRSVTTSSGSQYEILRTWALAPGRASATREP